MFNMLLQLHHHRHKEQHLISAKSISEITPPLHPLQRRQANTIDCCCISSSASTPCWEGRYEHEIPSPPQNTAPRISLRGVTTHWLSLCESGLLMGCTAQPGRSTQCQKCARCCTSMEKSPKLLPGRPLGRKGMQDAEQGGRSSSSVRCMCLQIGNNLLLLGHLH